MMLDIATLVPHRNFIWDGIRWGDISAVWAADRGVADGDL